jgi:hypothetical protein
MDIKVFRIYSENFYYTNARSRQFCCRLTPHLRDTIWITSGARKASPPPPPVQQPDRRAQCFIHSHLEFVKLVSIYKNSFMQISWLKLSHINGEIRIHVTRDWPYLELFIQRLEHFRQHSEKIWRDEKHQKREEQRKFHSERKHTGHGWVTCQTCGIHV